MYCLDTNAVIYYQKGEKNLVEKINFLPGSDICIAHITRMELLFGAYKSDHSKMEYNLALQTAFCENIKVVDSNKSSDMLFAKIKADLRAKGTIVDDMDIMIASICIANDLILVTNNLKHFSRIESLKLENWVEN